MPTRKQALYLLPLVLLILNLLPLSLYKDTVDFSPKGTVAFGLEPRHWKLLNYDARTTNTTAVMVTDQSQSTKAPDLLSKGASFRGFPFGAYFSKSVTQTKGSSSGSLDVSAWSWLWGLVDALILLIAFLLVRKFTKRPKIVQQPAQPPAPSPTPSYAQPIMYAAPPSPPQDTITPPETPYQQQ